jgi:SAM-dependent methyltransferase
MTDAPMTDAWDDHARWWQTHFTQGADPEYEEQILPLAAELLAGADRVLDVGCGEGQLARRLAVDGSFVAGVDASGTQLQAAVHIGGGPQYARAMVGRLPFADASFDAVVVCLVLEHVDDLDGAVAELTRVLRPDGRLALFLNHPLLQTPESGWIDDHILDPPERYWRVGPYLDEVAFVEQVARDVSIRFVHRPLHRYVNTLADAGIFVTRLLEPPPPPGFLARAREYEEARTIPRLMVLLGERGVVQGR